MFRWDARHINSVSSKGQFIWPSHYFAICWQKHNKNERAREPIKKSPLKQTRSNKTTAASRKFLHCMEDKYGFLIAGFMGWRETAAELDN